MENGDTYYGATFTAAHMYARAVLFGEDPSSIMKIYEAAKNTLADKEWYTMHQPAVAGPLMLGLLEGKPRRRVWYWHANVMRP